MSANLYEYVINELSIRRFAESYRASGVPGYPISSNGSFYMWVGGQNPRFVSAGPAVLPGSKPETGSERGQNRGGVGIVNGQVMVRRLINYPTPQDEDLKKAFGGKMPNSFMGGGFMLIEDSKNVAFSDLTGRQSYDQQKGKQLERNNHILIGNKGNSAYLVVALQLDHNNIVARLTGYSHLCMLDGGKAFWVKTPELNISGTNYGSPEPPYFALGVRGKLMRKS